MVSFSNKDVKDETLMKVQNLQTFFILMELSSKLFEASEIIKKDFFASSISKEYDSLLSDDAKESLKKIKRYFDTENIIKKMRNKFISHLDSIEIENSFNATPGDEVFEFYLSESDGNSFFIVTNIMTSYNIFNTIDKSDHTKALEALLDNVLENVTLFRKFLGNCVSLVAKKYLDKSLAETKEIIIADAPSIDEGFAPYFVEERKK